MFTSEKDVNISSEKIHAFVRIECRTDPPFLYQKSFPLPRKLIDAFLSIVKHFSITELYNISKDRCDRSIKIIVNDAVELKPGFEFFVRKLREKGINVIVVRKED
ncbi:MAG: hypothetical protein QXZ63_07605 [Sulfolobales archaeon]